MSEPGLGSLVRRLRKTAGLTQEALAERALLSVRTLSDIESGAQRRPRRDTLESIAQALGVTPAERAALAAAAAVDAHAVRFAPDADLPASFPPLIGRDDDVAALIGLLARPEVRLLTLTGTGGVGKTRLALEAARRCASDLERETFFVELVPVRDPEAILAAIARTVCGGEPAHPEAAIAAALGARAALIVVDNLEHLRSGAPCLARLIAATARVSILATSRFALGLRGERLYPVEGLRRDDAVALLVERIRAERASYDPAADLVQLGEIVDRLDRLPLAIELVAPRTRVFSIPQLLERLATRLPLLVSTSADFPERHRTLRDTIAWTYDLLEPREQEFFLRCTELRGHFSVEDAERTWLAGDAAHLIESLLEKNLLVRCEHAGGVPHFGMLQTIREFAGELHEPRGAESA
jgi:transcriptional regulator with XRE-family HTH domain